MDLAGEEAMVETEAALVLEVAMEVMDMETALEDHLGQVVVAIMEEATVSEEIILEILDLPMVQATLVLLAGENKENLTSKSQKGPTQIVCFYLKFYFAMQQILLVFIISKQFLIRFKIIFE